MKTKLKKKLMACAVAVLMVMNCAVLSGADTGAGSVIDTGREASLTLVKVRENSGTLIETGGKKNDPAGIEKMSGISFGVLKIADIETVAADDGIGTYFTNLDSSFTNLLARAGISAESVRKGGKTCYTADALYAALGEMNAVSGETPGETLVNTFVRNHSGTKHSAKTDASGTTVVDHLPLGLYLVAEEMSAGDTVPGEDSPSPEVIHNPSSPFLVSLPMTDQDHASSWLYDVTVYPKNQTVRIPKYIVSSEDGDTLLSADDLEIGKRVREIIVSDVPAVQQIAEGKKNRNYESYVVSDTMEEGLSFAEMISVRLGPQVADPEKLTDFSRFTVLTPGTDYEVLKGSEGNTALTVSNAAGTKKFRVRLLDAGLARLNSMKGAGQILVEFEAVVTRDADDGEGKVNSNKPYLTVKNANTEEYTTGGNEPGVFTYRIKLKKNGVTDPTKVTFSVTRNGKTMKFVREKAGVYHPFDSDLDSAGHEQQTEAISPGADGMLIIRGLDADSYRFTEKSTENGFELLKSSFTVELQANNPPDGNLKGAVLKTEDGSANLTVSKGTAGFSVDNMRSIILRTGGTGVRGFYTGGLILLAAAALLAAYGKRRRAGR